MELLSFFFVVEGNSVRVFRLLSSFFFLCVCVWEELILVCRRPLVEGHSVVSFTDNAFSSVTLQVSQTGLMKRLTVTH